MAGVRAMRALLTQQDREDFPAGTLIIVNDRPAVITGHAPKHFRFTYTDTPNGHGQAIRDNIRRA